MFRGSGLVLVPANVRDCNSPRVVLSSKFIQSTANEIPVSARWSIVKTQLAEPSGSSGRRVLELAEHKFRQRSSCRRSFCNTGAVGMEPTSIGSV